jgi:GNAT superfamily N-acetyltransferase
VTTTLRPQPPAVPPERPDQATGQTGRARAAATGAGTAAAAAAAAGAATDAGAGAAAGTRGAGRGADRDLPAGRTHAPRSQQFTVRSNGRPVGSVWLAVQGRQGWIRDLLIAPEHRRRGHGSVAVLTAEELLRDWGCQRALVPVSAGEPAGLALAEGLGYVLERQVMVVGLDEPRDPRASALPPGAGIRPLRANEYPGWLADQQDEYVRTVVARGDLSRVEAEQRVPEVYAAILPHGVDSPGAAVRVLEVGGRRVGTVLVAFSAEWVAGRGWVYYVSVDEDARGRGYGRSLMLAAERECRAAGLRELGLNVFADNPAALRLYASLGYQVESRILTKLL